MSNDHGLFRNPTALLVLRVWMERGSVLPMRAYIHRTADVSLGFQQSTVETDIEAAVSAVRTWLEGFLDADAAAGATETHPDAPSNGHASPAEASADGPPGADPTSTNGADEGRQSS